MKKLIPALACSLLILTSCNNAQKEAEARKIDSLEEALATQRIIDSMEQVAAMQPLTIENTTATTTTTGSTGSSGASRSSGRRSSGGGSRTSSTTNNYNTYNQPATSTQAPAPEQKKGWSATAKGAVIGAGAGALTGALISDKKGKGAIIGGAIGAGAGAGTGLIIDNAKKKKELERQRQLQEQQSGQ